MKNVIETLVIIIVTALAVVIILGPAIVGAATDNTYLALYGFTANIFIGPMLSIKLSDIVADRLPL